MGSPKMLTPQAWKNFLLAFIMRGCNAKVFLAEMEGQDTDHENTDQALETSQEMPGNPVMPRAIPGCGGSINIRCTGGSITINRALYSCPVTEDDELPSSNDDHEKVLEELCNGKETCKVVPNNELMGDQECSEKEDKDKMLWMVYTCNGGGKDETTTDNLNCNSG